MGGQGSVARQGPARTLLAVEGEAATTQAVERLVHELRSTGREIVESPIERVLGRPPAPRLLVVVRVATWDDARLAVQVALRGFSLLAINGGPRDVADRLYDDLRRLGSLDIRSLSATAPGDPLSGDERRLLEALASGVSLGQAAATLHLSRRTADRRLAAARRALGATTTAEAIARLRRSPAA